MKSRVFCAILLSITFILATNLWAGPIDQIQEDINTISLLMSGISGSSGLSSENPNTTIFRYILGHPPKKEQECKRNLSGQISKEKERLDKLICGPKVTCAGFSRQNDPCETLFEDSLSVNTQCGEARDAIVWNNALELLGMFSRQEGTALYWERYWHLYDPKMASCSRLEGLVRDVLASEIIGRTLQEKMESNERMGSIEAKQLYTLGLVNLLQQPHDDIAQQLYLVGLNLYLTVLEDRFSFSASLFPGAISLIDERAEQITLPASGHLVEAEPKRFDWVCHTCLRFEASNLLWAEVKRTREAWGFKAPRGNARKMAIKADLELIHHIGAQAERR